MSLTKELTRPVAWGHLDTVKLEDSAIIRIEGWADPSKAVSIPSVFLDGWEITCMGTFKTLRPFVAVYLNLPDQFLGLAFEYLATPVKWRSPCSLAIRVDGQTVLATQVDYRPTTPHYLSLYEERRVLHRDDIYGYGPPVKAMSDCQMSALNFAKAPVLDFGCGLGLVVKELRKRGIECQGLEIDRPAISQHLLPEAKPFIKLYDGTLPLPYDSNSFESVTCFEVLEHVPLLEETLAELARVTRNRIVLSVPDIASIPRGHSSTVVPWHLLESTHVNFFTQNSLGALLGRHFKKVAFGRLSPWTVNDVTLYTSLLAIGEKE